MDERFAVPGVAAGTPVGEAAPLLLLAKAKPLFRLESKARAGTDMDAVHDMRVASRRLREAMRLLAPVYPARDFRRWYRRVKRITRALGPVRDADVFIDSFAALVGDLGAGGKRAVAFIIGYRMGQREQELETLDRELGRLDLTRRRASFGGLVRAVESGAAAQRSLAEFAHAEVERRAQAAFSVQPEALDEARPLRQHALRICYKRLRYAVEVFAPCYGEAFDELHDTLTGFQDTLGTMHDLYLFTELVRDPERREKALRAGVSADDLDEVADLLERRSHDEYERFRALAAEHEPRMLMQALLAPLTPALKGAM